MSAALPSLSCISLCHVSGTGERFEYENETITPKSDAPKDAIGQVPFFISKSDEARFIAGTEIIVDGGMAALCD